MGDLTYDERMVVLKARIGNGDSAVDVEWDEEHLCWTVQARGFGAYWFTVAEKGEVGYRYALRQAGELEARVQRMLRLSAEAKGADEEIRGFVHDRRREVDVKAAAEAEQCA